MDRNINCELNFMIKLSAFSISFSNKKRRKETIEILIFTSCYETRDRKFERRKGERNLEEMPVVSRFSRGWIIFFVVRQRHARGNKS